MGASFNSNAVWGTAGSSFGYTNICRRFVHFLGCGIEVQIQSAQLQGARREQTRVDYSGMYYVFAIVLSKVFYILAISHPLQRKRFLDCNRP
jgi:hypothetical protein